jgi:SAM-dependent methyltransferase
MPDRSVDWRAHWDERGGVADRVAASGLCGAGGVPLGPGDVAALRQPWVDLLEVAPHHRVLELGCGAGVVLDLLTARSEHVVGVDFSLPMLRHCTGRCLTLLQADVTALPLIPASFDRVIAASVLHYMRDERSALDALCAWIDLLRPGGRLVVGDVLLTPHHRYLAVDRERLEARLERANVRHRLIAPTESKRRLGVDRHDLVVDRGGPGRSGGPRPDGMA